MLLAEKLTICGLLADTVSDEVDAVTPAGKPVICTVALDENPFNAVMLTMVCNVAPGAIASDDVLSPREKSGRRGGVDVPPPPPPHPERSAAG